DQLLHNRNCLPRGCAFSGLGGSGIGRGASLRARGELAGGVVGLDAGAQVVLGLVAELLAGQGRIGLGPVLGEAVGILKIVGLKIGLQDAIELGDDVVEAPASAGAGVVDAAFARFHGADVGGDDIVDVDEIALLL